MWGKEQVLVNAGRRRGPLFFYRNQVPLTLGKEAVEKLVHLYSKRDRVGLTELSWDLKYSLSLGSLWVTRATNRILGIVSTTEV